MKKIRAFFLLLILPVIAMSQAVIVFEAKDHDFGEIKEEDGRVSYEFVFSNQGNEPLVLSKVQASCGCTTPSWTKSPVEPGQKGTIKVSYNPAGRPGKFSKNISVQSNATQERERLVIRGEVIPKPKDWTKESAAANIDGLSLERRTVEFNNIEKGLLKEQTLKIKNTSGQSLSVAFTDVPAYITVKLPNETLSPDEEEEVTFIFDTKKCAKWGPVSDDIFIVLNNKRDISDPYKISLISNIVEDFNKMTMEQKRVAPIIEVINRTINLGIINSGTRNEGVFNIRNVGEKPLEIRTIINNNEEIFFKQQHLTVRGGKTAELKFNLSAELKPGKYTRAVTLQTNDPKNVYVILSIQWEVK